MAERQEPDTTRPRVQKSGGQQRLPQPAPPGSQPMPQPVAGPSRGPYLPIPPAPAQPWTYQGYICPPRHLQPPPPGTFQPIEPPTWVRHGVPVVGAPAMVMAVHAQPTLQQLLQRPVGQEDRESPRSPVRDADRGQPMAEPVRAERPPRTPSPVPEVIGTMSLAHFKQVLHYKTKEEAAYLRRKRQDIKNRLRSQMYRESHYMYKLEKEEWKKMYDEMDDHYGRREEEWMLEKKSLTDQIALLQKIIEDHATLAKAGTSAFMDMVLSEDSKPGPSTPPGPSHL